MKAGKGFKKIIYSILCITALFAGVFAPVTVNASALPQTGSIALSYEHEDVEFRLHKVGMVDSDNKLVLTGEYANYNIDTETENVGQTLETYINRDGIAPLMTAVTDDAGELLFDNLDYAVYLVSGEPVTVNNTMYIPVPVLVYVPSRDGSNIADIEITIKYEMVDTTVPLDLAVLKIWRDSGNEDERPEELTIQLLKNGILYDTIKLNEGNNWKYEWTGLESGFVWTVVEVDVPSGYKVAIKKDASALVITNTKYSSSEITPPVVEPPEEPPKDNPPKDNPQDNPPGDSQDNSTGTSSNSAKLPQTGQLWWPVILLSCAGLFFVVIGLIFKRMDRE